MIELKIGGAQVDLGDNISILFQRQRTDYTNPTIVKNSFTKTIRLPGTKNNNRVFGRLWKLDRLQREYDFNPSKRVPFILMNAYSNIIEQGYVKLNNINWDGNFYTYDITLYGELGNLLYGLSYRLDEDTDEYIPLTLADLDLGFSEFIINKELIDSAWKRLDGDSSTSGDEYAIFDNINFMVSYDGAPTANNFDAKSVWCSVDRTAAVRWKDTYYVADNFPSEVVEDNVTYKYISTMISRMDPDDRYGLLELKDEISPLEARDLRSYLLRPVINIKKVFDAIGEYINTNFGYTLDTSDYFFSTYDFRSTWMTLSMLYEVNPDVESGTVITKRQLLSNTSSPASYLISFCKVYGIYLDVDYFQKKLTLTRMPNFFNGDKINELKLDMSKEIKITPLSFDKASYTFDYGEGDSEFLKKYKDTYGISYGSKKVNTGYRFDASTAPYIDNNVFRQGVDSIDQSVYYRYPYAPRSGILFTLPGPVVNDGNPPTYKLFDTETFHSTGEVKTTEGEMVASWYPTYNNYAYNISGCGYQYMHNWWIGLRPNVWQDSFPKLQFHSEDNKSVDGKNVLVKFTGFRSSYYGSVYSSSDRTYFNSDSYSDSQIDATRVNYLLSDDYPFLKRVIGKNCYYDNPIPSESYGGYTYINVINKIPSFSRSSYLFSRDYGQMPVMNASGFDTMTIYSTNGSVTKYNSYYTTSLVSSTGRQYSYFTYSGFKAHHRYFIAAAVKTSQASTIKTGNPYAYPDIVGSTKIDSIDLTYSDTVQLVASIVETGSTRPTEITSLSVYDLGSSVEYNTYYLIAYDLSELGLDDNITTAADAVKYFGVTPTRVGYAYHLADTLDFGISRELYVPYCTYEEGTGVYNQYWSRYISDLYSINTRIIECYCYLDNFDDVFREFYLYDDCLWILSKIVDWDSATKRCKATFIKVNDIDNYINGD